MSKQVVNNTKLGLFVLAGLAFLVFSLYMIGRNRNLFSSTFTVHAQFYNVDGLTPGNNVRFSGIDVGTVSKVVIPVAAGRNMAVLTEAAVRSTVLSLRGIDTTREFVERQHRMIEQTGSE